MYYSDKDKTVIEHVQRPLLPWRPPSLTKTECGLSIAGPQVITREAFLQKVKEQGKQRAAMSTCMTCFDTALNHPTWEENPVGCVARDTHRWHCKDELLCRELRALAVLVGRHAEEFAELMQDQEEIVPLSSVKPKRRPPTKTKW